MSDDILATIKFDAAGLVPAIAQQHDTGEVLMMAWMNRDAVAETLRTRRVTYWSRGRAKLWRKGETSGQEQNLVEMRVDCDGDTLLVLVDQKGVAVTPDGAIASSPPYAMAGRWRSPSRWSIPKRSTRNKGHATARAVAASEARYWRRRIIIASSAS